MYNKYGPIKNGNTYTFTVYAPNAQNVELVIGGESVIMVKEGTDFTVSHPASHMDTFHYLIDGVEKFDPYAKYIQDGLVSTIYESSYTFESPRMTKQIDKTSNVLEFYLPLVEGDNYIEKGINIVQKALAGGYTHVLLLPLHHHWYVGSLGYQPQGMFAPSWFYGTPDELKQMIDYIHSNGLSVLLDFVIWEFTETPEGNGLHKYDGSYIYSRSDAVSPFFGGYFFDLRKQYVRDFLRSSLQFWIEEYKIDGFRIDGMNEIIFTNTSEGPLNQRILGYINEIIGGLDAHFILEFIDSRRAQDVGFVNSIDERDILPFVLEFLLTISSTDPDPEINTLFNRAVFNGSPYDLTAVNHDFFMRGNEIIKVYDNFFNIGMSYLKEPTEEYTKKLMFILKFIHSTRNNTIDFAHIDLFSESFNQEFNEYRELLNEIWVEDPIIEEKEYGYDVTHGEKTISFNLYTQEVTIN